MKPIRLGAVSYLNARPMVYGLELQSDLFALRYDVPSKCAALLHEGSIDVGMIPAIIMYTYYGKVVGDVAALAAGVSPPRGPEYYALLVVGLVAIIVSTTMITRAARRAIGRQQPR